jgi:hypothetical protein
MPPGLAPSIAAISLMTSFIGHGLPTGQLRCQESSAHPVLGHLCGAEEGQLSEHAVLQNEKATRRWVACFLQFDCVSIKTLSVP